MECNEENNAEYDVGDNDDDGCDEQIYCFNEESDEVCDEEILNDYGHTQNSVKWVRNVDNQLLMQCRRLRGMKTNSFQWSFLHCHTRNQSLSSFTQCCWNCFRRFAFNAKRTVQEWQWVQLGQWWKWGRTADTVVTPALFAIAALGIQWAAC